MAHGQPDFGMYAGKKTVYGLSDMGELAARLGSPVIYDRRGDVIFLDDFTAGLAPYLTGAGGAGGSVAQSSVRSKAGGYSCLLTGGSDGSRYASVTKYLPYPIVSNLGFETSFTLSANIYRLQFWIRLFDGADYFSALLQFNGPNSRLEYEDSVGGDTVLEDPFAPLQLDYMFHTVKLVVDFVNQKWVRILLDDQAWDMEGVSLYTFADATASHLQAAVRLLSVAGNNPTSYIDSFIITQNEP